MLVEGAVHDEVTWHCDWPQCMQGAPRLDTVLRHEARHRVRLPAPTVSSVVVVMDCRMWGGRQIINRVLSMQYVGKVVPSVFVWYCICSNGLLVWVVDKPLMGYFQHAMLIHLSLLLLFS